MGNPWTDVQSDVVASAGVARIVPITLSGSSTISSFGTKIDLLQVTDESSDYAMSEPKSEYLSKELTSGYVLEHPKISFKISAMTGYEKAEQESGQDMFDIKALVSKAKMDSLIACKGSPVACMLSLGYNTAGTFLGWKHIIGYMGTLKESIKHDLLEIPIQIKGGFEFSGSTYSAYNTAMTATTIEPIGMSAYTPVAIDGTDYTNLLAGTIVRKAIS
jgi:hypothetical protein